MEYTDNLKIILLENNVIKEDNAILNEIKSVLSKNNSYKIE